MYLLHQPYVMYVGGRLSGIDLQAALAILCLALAAIVWGSSLAERFVNRITGRQGWGRDVAFGLNGPKRTIGHGNING